MNHHSHNSRVLFNLWICWSGPSILSWHISARQLGRCLSCLQATSVHCELSACIHHHVEDSASEHAVLVIALGTSALKCHTSWLLFMIQDAWLICYMPLSCFWKMPEIKEQGTWNRKPRKDVLEDTKENQRLLYDARLCRSHSRQWQALLNLICLNGKYMLKCFPTEMNELWKCISLERAKRTGSHKETASLLSKKNICWPGNAGLSHKLLLLAKLPRGSCILPWTPGRMPAKEDRDKSAHFILTLSYWSYSSLSFTPLPFLKARGGLLKWGELLWETIAWQVGNKHNITYKNSQVVAKW